jgi:hypothetical protein
MERNARAIEVIFSAVDELNRQLPKDQQLNKSVDTPLTGQAATLDSIGLVNLIVITEQKIEEHFNVALTLAEDGLASADEGPFQSIGSLIEHVSLVLEGKARG